MGGGGNVSGGGVFEGGGNVGGGGWRRECGWRWVQNRYFSPTSTNSLYMYVDIISVHTSKTITCKNFEH